MTLISFLRREEAWGAKDSSRRVWLIFRGTKGGNMSFMVKTGWNGLISTRSQELFSNCPAKNRALRNRSGHGNIAARPASTPWALRHDSAKVAFSVVFFKRLDVLSVGSCGLKWEKKLCSSVEKSVENSTQWRVTLETFICQLFCNCWAAVQIQWCVPIYLFHFFFADWNLESKKNTNYNAAKKEK